MLTPLFLRVEPGCKSVDDLPIQTANKFELRVNYWSQAEGQVIAISLGSVPLIALSTQLISG